ncbi:hypothetical protein PLICBS_000052 [Purpureocillium lilacinum]|uniref:uncharacterized protein n=1 Tax=Purpureocillium lilacinum TaxID=33203 RepID=UPI002082FAE1|nr:hypothetical protein PLICBS_000052 [Purpureocillium lilacinum]
MDQGSLGPFRAAKSNEAACPIDNLLNPAAVADAERPRPLQVDVSASSGSPDRPGGGAWMQAEAYHDDGGNGDGGSVYTRSVTSSIYDYQYENGRRYHAYREGQYVLSNANQEQERLILQHYIWRLLLGGRLYTAALPDPSTKPTCASSTSARGLASGQLTIDVIVFEENNGKGSSAFVAQRKYCWLSDS